MTYRYFPIDFSSYEDYVIYLKEKGFDRYEVSNFAKDGFKSRHNLNYWQRGEYIGFGVSASSFIKERRFTNTEKINVQPPASPEMPAFIPLHFLL